MALEEYEGLVLPSNPSDQKRLNAAFEEVVNSLAKIAAETEQKNNIVTHIVEEFGIPKSLINKASKAMFKDKCQAVAAESQDLETLIDFLKPSDNYNESDE